MVLLTLGAFRYSGLDSDIVSLPLNIESGAIFDAVDTLRKFVFNGTAWVEFVKGTGEINEMANVGVGTGLIFRDKIGVTFNIKSLIGGTNVLVTDNADDITISTTGASPLTTKGDIFAFSTVDDRLPVGTDGQVLSANSAIGIGLEWIDSLEVFTWSANHDANGFALEAPLFADPIDTTKLFQLSLVNMTTGITLTLLTAQSTSQTLSIPNITQSDTLVTEKFPQVLAQKTLDLPIITDFTNATHDHSNSVGAGALGNKVVTVPMLADGVDGELITWDSLGVADTVAVGTVDDVLTSRGVGLPPTFQPAGGGGVFTKIEVNNPSSTQSWSIPLNSKSYYEIYVNLVSDNLGASGMYGVRLNGNTGNNYSWRYQTGGNEVSSSTASFVQMSIGGASFAANIFMKIQLFKVFNVTYVIFNGGSINAGPEVTEADVGVGVYKLDEAITSIEFFDPSQSDIGTDSSVIILEGTS